MWNVAVPVLALLSFSRVLAVIPTSAQNGGGASSGSIDVSPNSMDYVPIQFTAVGPALQGGRIYTVDILDSTVTLRIAVADDDPLDPVALQATFLDTLRIAREKMATFGGTTPLHPSDDPFVSDTKLFTRVTIQLQSKSKNRRSRQRLKYGRVLLVLRALNTFLYEGRRWNAAVVMIADNGLLVGDASVAAHDVGSVLGGLGRSNNTS